MSETSASLLQADYEHGNSAQSTSPLPQPLDAPRQSYTGAAHGAFTPTEVKPWITKYLVPFLFVCSLTMAIGYTVANSQCSTKPVPNAWCCLSTFTRYLTLSSYWFHTVLCAWFIYLYHLPLIRFLPSSRRYYLPSFIFKVILLVTIWMVYFLFLSLSFISSLPEQVTECSDTVSTRVMFVFSDIVSWMVCITVKVMLGIMGKKVWKYWELRHLTPAELVAYEEAMETNRARGLSKEQLAVLTKVLLTCSHGTTNMTACPVCGYTEYQPPSLFSAVTDVVSHVSLGKLFSHSSHSSRPSDSKPDKPQNELELPNLTITRSTSSGHESTDPTEIVIAEEHSLHNGNSGRLFNNSSQSQSYEKLSDSTTEQRSRASLVPVGGQSSMTCAICLEDYLVHSRIMILPCRHHGHIDCLSPWFNGHLTCPTCRAKVVRDSH